MHSHAACAKDERWPARLGHRRKLELGHVAVRDPAGVRAGRAWRDDPGCRSPARRSRKGASIRPKERLEAAGIKDWMPHTCRHFWATSGHRVGMTPFDLAQEGGSKDIKMVQR